MEQASHELCKVGLAEQRGRRLARIGAAARASAEGVMLRAALPSDGASVGGLRLRSILDLDNETYAQAKQELHAAGLIVL